MTRPSLCSIPAADEPRQGLWVYARERQPWSGPEPPAAIYLFASDRKAERPIAHLADFKGIPHVDGYAGFEQLADKEVIILAACWSHSRRKFYDVAEATGSPVATDALRRIGELYNALKACTGMPRLHRTSTDILLAR